MEDQQNSNPLGKLDRIEESKFECWIRRIYGEDTDLGSVTIHGMKWASGKFTKLGSLDAHGRAIEKEEQDGCT